MATALNPITEPAALAADPNLEPERRVQALWHAWLRRYFSGTPFTTRKAGGGTESRTFTTSKIVWGEAEADAAGTPIIHAVLIDSRSERRDRTAGLIGANLDWSLQLMVKVANNLTGKNQTSAREPEFIARRLADQLAWLIQSSERAALTEKGVHNIRLASGPLMLPASYWQARILNVVFRTRREVPAL